MNAAFPSPIIVEKIDPLADAEALCDALMEQTLFSETIPFMEWIDYSVEENLRIVQAIKAAGEKPNGFVSYQFSLEQTEDGPELTISIERWYTSDAHRRKGVGKALLTAIDIDFECFLKAAEISGSTEKEMGCVFIADSFSPFATRLLEDLSARIRQELVKHMSEAAIRYHTQITELTDD